MYSRHSSHSDDLASALAGGILLILIVAVALTAFLVVKALRLLWRVFMRYPHSRPLWLALAICLGLWGLTALALLLQPSSALVGFLAVLALAGTAGLLITARVVELYHDQLFQQERQRGALVTDILSRPWWAEPRKAA